MKGWDHGIFSLTQPFKIDKFTQKPVTVIFFPIKMPTPKLSFQIHKIAKNSYQIDVFFENIPKNFLGAAFDISIENKGWKLKKYNAGTLFEKPSEVFFLTTERKSPERKLISGISLKEGDHISKDQGILTTYNITTTGGEDPRLSFKNGIVSVFENGRKDISPVAWQNFTIDEEKTANIEESGSQKAGLSKNDENKSPFFDTSNTEEENTIMQQKPPTRDTSSLSTEYPWIQGIIGGTLCFLIIIIFIKKLAKKEKKFDLK